MPNLIHGMIINGIEKVNSCATFCVINKRVYCRIVFTRVIKVGCVVFKKIRAFTNFAAIQGVPHLRGFHYRGSGLMYVQVGDFLVSRLPTTVPLMRILRNVVFSSPTICVSQGPSVLFGYQSLCPNSR